MKTRQLWGDSTWICREKPRPGRIILRITQLNPRRTARDRKLTPVDSLQKQEEQTLLPVPARGLCDREHRLAADRFGGEAGRLHIEFGLGEPVELRPQSCLAP